MPQRQGNKIHPTDCGQILYYARAIDMTVLMALSLIEVEKNESSRKKHWTNASNY
jgi:hypothetical protein